MQEFYRIYHKSHSAYLDYREHEANWEKTFENAQNQKKESIYEHIRNLQLERSNRQSEQLF